MNPYQRNQDQDGSTRRACERSPVFERVSWRGVDGGRWKPGMLVNVSPLGLAMLTYRKDAPPSGCRINIRVNSHEWSKPLDVIRVEQASDILDLVAAQFPETHASDAPTHPRTRSQLQAAR
ncbi:MAG: hypothetical protein JXQ73_10440 [Phycisphaerae bacterium]|nr:hypothetical protein [Phycisphaerae bacterium]